MKTIGRTLTVLLLSSVLLSSCDDTLDLAPLGELNSETFYNTEKDFEAASLAPYSTILNLYYDQFGLGWFQGVLMPDDDVRNPQGNNDQEEFNWLPTNGQFSYLWNESYKAIMRSHVILDRLPGATGFADPSQKTRFEAEAKFIRAYFYFILARNFGNPPLVTELIKNLESANVGNSQAGEVWDLIESDLTFAKANLPAQWSANNVGRATKWASAALLGKVRLYRAQWEGNNAKYAQAATEFQEVVSSGLFSLVNDYGDNFREATENNPESVFEVQMTRGDFNPWLPTDFGLAGNQNVGAAGSGRKIFTGTACHVGQCAPGANGFGYGQVHITLPLQEAFALENDPRVFHTYYREGEDYGGQPYSPAWSITGASPAKYIRPFNLTDFPNNITTNNERVIRYADVLLMLAEAKLLGSGDVAGAAALINQVRDRARAQWQIVYNEPAPEGLLPARSASATVDQMFEWLMHERRMELALECHRYDDLVRWHRAGKIDIKTDVDFGNTLAQQNWAVKHLLKPIPQGELDNNPNLVQHTGY